MQQANRSLVANLAAAEKYHVSDIKTPEKWKFVENAEYFYVGSFFLTVSVETILEIAKYAAEHNKVRRKTNENVVNEVDSCVHYAN
jgi:adenosine kinase